MRCRVEYRPYQRPFSSPLQTQHGRWTVRQGIVVKLTTPTNQTAYGEIAPLPWFGTESWEQAWAFCQRTDQFTEQTLVTIPAGLPACQFGFESAWEHLTHAPQPTAQPWPQSCLLPTGAAALQVLQECCTTQPNWLNLTFKWKIGVAPIQTELDWLEQLIAILPRHCQLRLDANGGLCWDDACRWLTMCDRHSIEFLEQPLPPEQFDNLLQLSDRFSTPIALDESITTIKQLETCYHKGWRGIFVIKAAIAGSPKRLRKFCHNHEIDVVWSSVLETAIAQRFIQERLIPSVPRSERAIGFGVNQWFADGRHQMTDEQVWQSL